jgi:hypothetical protein
MSVVIRAIIANVNTFIAITNNTNALPTLCDWSATGSMRFEFRAPLAPLALSADSPADAPSPRSIGRAPYSNLPERVEGRPDAHTPRSSGRHLFPSTLALTACFGERVRRFLLGGAALAGGLLRVLPPFYSVP